VASLRRDPDKLYAAVQEDIDRLTERLDVLTDARADDEELDELNIVAGSLSSLWADFDQVCRNGDYPKVWRR